VRCLGPCEVLPLMPGKIASGFQYHSQPMSTRPQAQGFLVGRIETPTACRQ